MQSIPLRRTIFLWTCILAFFIIAPTIVFYTAGYRWNPKKGAVERNGTFIIDTQPSGAQIFLNGDFMSEKSPYTFKNLAPGTYHVSLQLAGYHAWEKTLEIKPERVTFANNIHLWMSSEPELVSSGHFERFEASPNGKYAVAFSFDGVTSSLVLIETPSMRTSFIFSDLSSPDVRNIEWNDASSGLLVRLVSGGARAVSLDGSTTSVALPQGEYRWEGDDIVGVFRGERYVYSMRNDVVQREVLNKGVRDVQGSYEIVSFVGSASYGLRSISKPDRVFGLPSGDWTFESSKEGRLFFRSGSDWMEFDPKEEDASAHRFTSDEKPLFMKTDAVLRFVTVRNGELFLTEMGKDPELLLRRSSDIVGVAWHRLGRDVFFATKNDVVVTELDSRDKRNETVLASFDEIYGILVDRREIFISGKRGDQEGIWTLAIE